MCDTPRRLLPDGRSDAARRERSERIARAGANVEANLTRLVRAWEQALTLTCAARAAIRRTEALCCRMNGRRT